MAVMNLCAGNAFVTTYCWRLQFPAHALVLRLSAKTYAAMARPACSPAFGCCLVPVKCVHAQHSHNKKAFLLEQMRTQLDPVKLGLTQEVRRLLREARSTSCTQQHDSLTGHLISRMVNTVSQPVMYACCGTCRAYMLVLQGKSIGSTVCHPASIAPTPTAGWYTSVAIVIQHRNLTGHVAPSRQHLNASSCQSKLV